MTLWRSIEVACLLLALLLSMWGCGSEPPSCPEGQELCGTQCFDVQTAANHCGACGASCEAGEVCNGGTCELGCAQGMSACEGGCFDTQASSAHCGACGTSCEVGQVCEAGACVLSCSQDLSQCDGGCVDTQSDENHCGACGTSCGLGELCVDGACAPNCAAGLDACDGACVDTQVDRANCGGCGVACASGEVCVAGSCELSCQDGFDVCDDTCVDLQANSNYCGDCNTACPEGELCEMGACVISCEPARLACDGACVDPQTNDNHCGECGNVCAADQDCFGGSCVVACLPGEERCGAECVDVLYNPQSCGACGVMCAAGESCIEGGCFPCTDCPRFAYMFGGSGSDTLNGIQADALGNIYAIGSFQGMMTAGDEVLTSAGSDDVLVLKLSPTGKVIWSFTAGGPDGDEGTALEIDDAGNVYIAGTIEGDMNFGGTPISGRGLSDIFVAKLDPNGSLVWVEVFGSSTRDEGTAVTVAPNDGDVIVAGWVTGSVNGQPHRGAADIFVARLDNSGATIKVDAFGSNQGDRPRALAADAAGNAYLAGEFSGTVGWKGGGSVSSGGSLTAFVTKFDDVNTVQWVANSLGNSNEGAYAIDIDGNGDIYIGGLYNRDVTFGAQTITASQNTDAFVAKLDDAGNWIWAKGLDGWGAEAIEGVAVAGSKLYAAGRANGGLHADQIATELGGQFDIFLAEFDTNGTTRGLTSAGVTSSNAGLAIASDPQGNFYLAGRSTGQLRLGEVLVAGNGNFDGFLARYDASAEPLCPTRAHEVCNGICTQVDNNSANCGDCGVTCATAAGEVCAAGTCQSFPEGLVLSEVHLGIDSYIAVENRGSTTVDLSTIYYRSYELQYWASANGQLPPHMLAPGEEVYLVSSTVTRLPDDLSLPQALSSGTGVATVTMLCLGPCTQNFADNLVDVVVAGGFGFDLFVLNPGITFSPAYLSTLQGTDANSYLRTGSMGSNPNFLESDWTVGPATR